MKRFLISTIVLIASLVAWGQPLSGTYTVGGATPDYSTLTAAATALNTNGVSGPVIMNIAPGIYLEQFTLNAITGASSTNTITFQSASLDSTTVTISFNATSNNYLINLNNSDHIRIKGINFQPLNSTNKVAIYLQNGCSNVHVTNNLFSGGCISVLNNISPSLYNQYRNNRFTTVASNNQINASSSNTVRSKGTLIQNNIFEGTASRSISLFGEDSLNIAGNTITGSRTNYNIELSYCGPVITIEKNNIILTSTTGLYLNQCSGTTLNRIMVRNNMIKSPNNPISVNYTNYISILNNTFESAGGTNSCSVYFASNNSNVDLYNNIMSNSMGGFGLYLSQIALISTMNSDYNALYSSGTNKVKASSTGFTLADWTTTYGKDANSITDQPVYISATDLHMDNCTPMNGAGTPQPFVTDDIDGQPRNLTTPDIGADEFDLDPNSFQDIAILGPVSPDTTSCLLENQIEVAVVNHSVFPITSFVIYWQLFDQVMNTMTVTTPIPPGDTINVVLGNYDFNHNTGYNLYFEATLPNNEPDDFPFDNEYAFTYYHLNDLTIYERPVSDCTTDKELNIKSFPCETVVWSTGETTRLITVSSPGTYSVTVTTNGGCVLTDSITIN